MNDRREKMLQAVATQMLTHAELLIGAVLILNDTSQTVDARLDAAKAKIDEAHDSAGGFLELMRR